MGFSGFLYIGYKAFGFNFQKNIICNFIRILRTFKSISKWGFIKFFSVQNWSNYVEIYFYGVWKVFWIVLNSIKNKFICGPLVLLQLQ